MPPPARWTRVLVYLAALILLGFFDRTVHKVAGSDLVLKTSESLPSARTGRELCRAKGWRPFKTGSSATHRKVYDLIMINTELDWLEIRLNTLYDYVDYFIIVESGTTFTGLSKPLLIKESLGKFAAFKDKLIYHELQYPPGFSAPRPWDREDLQRDATYTQVFPRLTGDQEPAWGDVLIVADVDEIPRPETITLLRLCDFPRRLTLRSRFYYYSFQFLHQGKEWDHPQATFYEGSRTIKPSNLRIGDGGIQPIIYWDKADLWNAGWHCSSCFRTMEELLTKMKSFSHTWMNGPEYQEKSRIAEHVRNGKDLWDRERDLFDRIDNNTDVPLFLQQQPENFGYMLDRDGPSAGFSDYKGG
ncbi:glycosyltransferase family 17 protein [Thozetella sp. PMI_491]|nr:glycosyltransferase family 17 protein [Thozetella sp. PMI_491]